VSASATRSRRTAFEEGRRELAATGWSDCATAARPRCSTITDLTGICQLGAWNRARRRGHIVQVRKRGSSRSFGASACGKSVSRRTASCACREAGRAPSSAIRQRIQLRRAGSPVVERGAHARGARPRHREMIFQEPMTSPNPADIGLQLPRPLMIHLGHEGDRARARAPRALDLSAFRRAARSTRTGPNSPAECASA